MDLSDDDDDSERTELYTPPPLDFDPDEKENQRFEHFPPKKEQSVIVLDDSIDQPVTTTYWDQWPLVNDEIERFQISSNSTVDVRRSPEEILDFSTAPIEPKATTTLRAPLKRKKKKKAMSEYRAPSPFSPKPDYKSMDADELKNFAIRYGLASNLSKGRLVKILDEIYDVTHQYETDSDFEWQNVERSRTPPTPAVIPNVKKAKTRAAIHQMSSSDEPDDRPVLAGGEEKSNSSNDDDGHEGRFLELTVHELSTSLSSHDSPKKTKTKRAKLQTPTMPLKEILRNYIEANPTLHARILSYEPIDFEEFHKQMKNDLTMKIASKELMQCLDDQCITFTLRSRKGAFTSVMRAKRRQK